MSSISSRLAPFAVTLLAMLPLSAAAELFPAGAENLQQEVQQASRKKMLLAVLFELPDCGTCRQLRQNALSDNAAARDFAKRFRSVGVNLLQKTPLTTPEGKTQQVADWARGLRINGTPAIAFFKHDGQLLYRHHGSLANSKELRQLAQYVSNGEYENQPLSAYRTASHKTTHHLPR